MLSFFHRMTIYLPLLIKLYNIWMKVLLMVRFKNNYDVLNLCFRDASDIYIQRNMNIEANPFIACTQTLLYFPFVLFKNIGEHAVWERKIKNACRHLWEKRGLWSPSPMSTPHHYPPLSHQLNLTDDIGDINCLCYWLKSERMKQWHSDTWSCVFVKGMSCQTAST